MGICTIPRGKLDHERSNWLRGWKIISYMSVHLLAGQKAALLWEENAWVSRLGVVILTEHWTRENQCLRTTNEKGCRWLWTCLFLLTISRQLVQQDLLYPTQAQFSTEKSESHLYSGIRLEGWKVGLNDEEPPKHARLKQNGPGLCAKNTAVGRFVAIRSQGIECMVQTWYDE